MRKRRERKRDKNSSEDQLVDAEVSDSPPDGELESTDSQEPDAAFDSAETQTDTDSELKGSDSRLEASSEPEAAALSIDTAAEDAPADRASPAPPPQPSTAPLPQGEAASQPQSGAAGDDLEALGRLLEHSLTGSAEGPLPNVAAKELSPDQSEHAGLPPDISATPEDILGVPTQHAAIREMNAQEENQAGESRPPQNIGGIGTGSAPMEDFDERAQMAKEVLRASSNRPSAPSAQAPRQVDEDPPGDGEFSGGHDEIEEDVRFSEDLTISVKRRRKLFGR